MKSLRFAVAGIVDAVKTERNMRIHIAAVYYVVVMGRLCEIERWAWAAVALSCCAVIGAEAFNTAIERLCDAVAPQRNAAVGAAKDIAAGAVLVCAAGAVCVAFAVFWGRPFNVFSRFEFQANAVLLPLWAYFIFSRRWKKK